VLRGATPLAAAGPGRYIGAMTTMISEGYDAFRDAQGVSEDKARKAAEAVAPSEKRFADMDVRFESIQGQLRVMQWMLATLVAGTIAALLKLYS